MSLCWQIYPQSPFLCKKRSRKNLNEHHKFSTNTNTFDNSLETDDRAGIALAIRLLMNLVHFTSRRKRMWLVKQFCIQSMSCCASVSIIMWCRSIARLAYIATPVVQFVIYVWRDTGRALLQDCGSTPHTPENPVLPPTHTYKSAVSS